MKLIDDNILKENIPNAYLNGSGSHYIGDCPFCGKEKHLYIQRKTNRTNMHGKNESYMWQCKKCEEQGSIYKLFSKLGCLDLLKGIKYVEVNEKLQSIDELIQTEKKEEIAIKPPIGFKKIVSSDYLNQRGFTKQEYEKYKIGKTSLLRVFKDYIIFLIEELNECKGYVCRYVGEESGKPKYLNKPESVRFGNLLFGIDEIDEKTDTVVLVEGIFDKFSLDRYLDDYLPNIKCLVTFGKKLSDAQTRKILQKNIKKIIILYDKDAMYNSIDIAKTIEYLFDSVLIGNCVQNDPGECDLDDFHYIFNHLHTASHYSMSTLNSIEY